MKRIKNQQITGFVFTGIAGVLLHFLYSLANRSVLVAPFCAVNESIWEHMKLLFIPLAVYALIQYKYITETRNNFLSVKLAGVLCGVIIIPVLYYTYTGAFGVYADWFNIAIFFIASAAAFFVEYLLFRNPPDFCLKPLTAALILVLIAACFVIFTFIPPHLPLFKDPVTNSYGI